MLQEALALAGITQQVQKQSVSSTSQQPEALSVDGTVQDQISEQMVCGSQAAVQQAALSRAQWLAICFRVQKKMLLWDVMIAHEQVSKAEVTRTS